MASSNDEDHDELVEHLTTGFRALLNQVHDLARKNHDLEQRLTLVRDEVYHVMREDGPLAYISTTGPQTGKQAVSQEVTSQPSDIPMAVEGQEDAQAIASGVYAWKVLIGKRLRGTQGAVKKRSAGQSSPAHTDARSAQDDVAISGSIATSRANENPEEEPQCPFASLSDLRPEHQAFRGSHGSVTKRPDLLPTPPDLREEFIINPPGNNQQPRTFSSPPPSATGSASKCPIRYLDERSPEDIARYFENHKHEIPRSHEVCVKHHQSNEESIRQLDAKYGNLVSMIQGLGMKHKPLLPTKEEEESLGMERRSTEKVEEWAVNVKSIPDNASSRSAGLNIEDREGHFDRPLEDIRVGESPSRPWGIRVPIEEERAYSASRSLGPSGPDKAIEHGRRIPEEGIVEETAEVSNKAEAPYPSQPVSEALRPPQAVAKTDEPRMLFTGPVFIGYPPEQAAEMIRQCVVGMNIPRSG